MSISEIISIVNLYKFTIDTCNRIEDSKRLAYEYISHAVKIFQDKIGVSKDITKDADFLLNSVIDEYISKLSRESFLHSLIPWKG